MKTSKETVSATMEIDGIEIDVEGVVEYYIDNNWGADADGNRGSTRIFIDEIDNIRAFSESEEIALSENDYEMAIEILSDKFFESR